MFQLQAELWIGRCKMPQRLRLFVLQICSFLHSLDDFVWSNALSIWQICLQEVAKCSFSEYVPLLLMVTLSLGKMLNIARYGEYRGTLRL